MSHQAISNILLTLIVILTISFVALFFIDLPGQRKEPTPTPTLTPASTDTPDPTANWQTYINEEFGFEVKYPNDLVKSGSIGEVVLRRLKMLNQCDNTEIIILATKNTYLTEQEWSASPRFHENAPEYGVFSQFADQPAFRAIPKDSELENIDRYNLAYLNIYSEKNNGSIGIALDSGNQDLDCKKKFLVLFDQILSTFKFID